MGVFVLDFPPSKFCPPCHPVNAFVPLPAASIFTSPQLGQYQPSECLEEDAKTTRRRKRRKSSKLCLATKRKRKKSKRSSSLICLPLSVASDSHRGCALLRLIQ